MKNKRKIGFSIQPLVCRGMSIQNAISLVKETGGNAIELVFESFSGEDDFNLSSILPSKFIDELKSFDYISIHAFCNKQEYSTKEMILNSLKKLRNIVKNIPVAGIVFHPDIIDVRFLSQKAKGLPSLLENNDKKKGIRTGTCPEDFKKWGNFGFVLDLYHLYDLDPTMSQLSSFLNIMGKNLRELHVSGEGHQLLYQKHNKAIEGALKEIISKNDLPIILEGILSPADINQARKDMKKEIEYIKRILGDI